MPFFKYQVPNDTIELFSQICYIIKIIVSLIQIVAF